MVGRGLTVGRPLGLLLTRRSENSTTTLCHTGTRDLAAHARAADVIIAAAGVPGLITADMVQPGAAVLDVGVLPGGRKDRRGRPRRRSLPWPGHLTPNPGGVGPMTRAMLLSNVVAAGRATGRARGAGVNKFRLGTALVVRDRRLPGRAGRAVDRAGPRRRLPDRGPCSPSPAWVGLCLPEGLVGAFAIRSRAVDCAAFLILAILVAVIFTIVKLTPLAG